VCDFRYGGFLQEIDESHGGERRERDYGGAGSWVSWQEVGHTNPYRPCYRFQSYSWKKTGCH